MRIRHRAAAAAASARATGSRPPAARAATSSPIPKNPDVVYGGSYGGLLDARQPPHRRVPRRQSLAGQPDGRRRGRAEVPLPVELPDPLLAARPEHALRRGAACCSRATDEGQSWKAISPDLTRNDKSKQGSVRRPDHQGQHQRRVLRHDLRRRRVAARAGRDLDRLRRRPGPRHARRRQDWKNVTPQGDCRSGS